MYLKEKNGWAGHDTYQSPKTERNRVQTEGGLCTTSATLINDDTQNGKINEHTINQEGPSFSGDIGWDERTNN